MKKLGVCPEKGVLRTSMISLFGLSTEKYSDWDKTKKD